MLKQEAKPSEQSPAAPNADALKAALSRLARGFYPMRPGKRQAMTKRVLDLYSMAQGKDVIILHSPGGWGNTRFDGLLDWERSIVSGVASALEKLGHNAGTAQYIRAGGARYAHFPDVLRDIRFFTTGASPRADVAAAEIKLLLKYLPHVRIVLVGASQGAAFDNAVMSRLGDQPRVYSIECGTFFPHIPRRVITDRTLAVDDNGLMPDPLVDRDLWAGAKSYAEGFRLWVKLWFKGKHVQFTHLTNTPGHEYRWEYPGVRPRVVAFLAEKFGDRNRAEMKK